MGQVGKPTGNRTGSYDTLAAGAMAVPDDVETDAVVHMVALDVRRLALPAFVVVVVRRNSQMSAGDWIGDKSCCCCCDCGRTCDVCKLSLFELVLKRSVRL